MWPSFGWSNGHLEEAGTFLISLVVIFCKFVAFNKTNPECLVRIHKPIATNKKTSIFIYLQRIWFFNRRKCLQTFVSSNQLDVKIPDLQLPFVLWPCPSSERFPWTGQKLRPKAEVQTRTLSPRLSRAGACCSYFVWDAKTPKRTKQNTTTTTRTTRTTNHNNNNNNNNNSNNKKKKRQYPRQLFLVLRVWRP